MNGVSSAIRSQAMASFLNINIEKEGYSVGWTKFSREANDAFLFDCTNNVLKVFQQLNKTISDNNSLDIDEKTCQEYLAILATWGQRAYQQFFNDEAQQILRDRFQMMQAMNAGRPTPTFISDMIPFPWEVLYDSDTDNMDCKQFWGLEYSLARILDNRDIAQYAWEQTPTSDMLFCLHHTLRHAHQHEWPAIEKLVRLTERDHFCLLGIHNLVQIQTGKDLLIYINGANHNMIHFACHAKRHLTGADVLQLSLLREDNVYTDEIELGTYAFLDAKKYITKFKCQPLVFLNACRTAGGPDPIRNTFNLPEKFIKHGAAAVIATICDVPDLFAAAFGRRFYTYFLQKHMTIGEALRATRCYFLKYHHNPLGLAYGLYSPSHYRLAQPLAEGIAS